MADNDKDEKAKDEAKKDAKKEKDSKDAKKDKGKKKKKSSKGKGGKSWLAKNQFFVGLVVVLVVVGAAFALTQPMPTQDQSPDQEELNDSQEWQEYASGSDETGRSVDDSTEADIQVSISNRGTDPARAEGSTGDIIQWTNNLGHAVALAFDRTNEIKEIAAGGTGKMQFRGITYYEVYNADTCDAEIAYQNTDCAAVAQGSVAVQ